MNRIHEIMKCFLDFAEKHMVIQNDIISCNNWSLTFDTIQKNLVKIQPYDVDQTISLIYIKAMFLTWLKTSQINVIDAITQKSLMDQINNLYNIFLSPAVTSMENSVLDSFTKLLEQTVQKKAIGNRNLSSERETFLDTIVAVCEELPDCHLDVFIKGGLIQPIQNYSTHIHIYPWLRDCLLALEDAPDGLYLCYVRCSGISKTSTDGSPEALTASPDGYFGYYIKSNGTLISISERLDEAYPGEHANHRNARYTEKHKYHLFPYNSIFTFDDYDYKGYATSQTITDLKSSFMNLDSFAYMPIIVAMLLLSRHYTGFDPSDHQQIYVDSLLPQNVVQAIDGSKALVPTAGSNLITTANALHIDMPLQSIMNGSFAHHLNHTTETAGRHYSEYGCFQHGDDNIFVKLYGEGFNPDYNQMLQRNDYKCIPDRFGKISKPTAEFVGSKIRMEIAAYYNIRIQLAEYIRDRMFEEYTAFGGVNKLNDWYQTNLIEQKERIINFCLQWELNNPDLKPCNIDGIYIRRYRDQEMQRFMYGFTEITYPFNKPVELHRNKCYCACSEYKASIFFVFSINNWHQIQTLLGDSVQIPKILQGFGEYANDMPANSILDATDACERIQTPFEQHEYNTNSRYWTNNEWQRHLSSEIPWNDIPKYIPENTPDRPSVYHKFNFGIGFSKRFWDKYVKNHTPKNSTQNESVKP